MTLRDLQNKVEKRISEYIEFDIKELFSPSDQISIYGGAVRDSIADLDIHDIDILCMPYSATKLRKFLEKKGYDSIDLYDPDSLNMYQGISLIAEPWTLMNSNRKVIQIIRPIWKGQAKRPDDPYPTAVEDYREAYYDLIKNVDLSCCGVFLEKVGKEIVLKESCKNAIVDCLSKCYETNEWSLLYQSNRTLFRQAKLSNRGWIDISYLDEIFKPYLPKRDKDLIKKERLRKINKLEFTPEYDYKIWTEEEYNTHTKSNLISF